MKHWGKRLFSRIALLLLPVLCAGLLSGCAGTGACSAASGQTDAGNTAVTDNAATDDSTAGESASAAASMADTAVSAAQIAEDGSYTSKEDVALYLHTYGHLPSNYITKKEAEELGWNSKEGNLWDVAPGKSIGGSRFGNYDGNLPEADGRKYYECDIGYEGGYRGAERIIYSNDGLIYYTEDHYKTFEQLY
jgi:ribonuclease T1